MIRVSGLFRQNRNEEKVFFRASLRGSPDCRVCFKRLSDLARIQSVCGLFCRRIQKFFYLP